MRVATKGTNMAAAKAITISTMSLWSTSRAKMKIASTRAIQAPRDMVNRQEKHMVKVTNQAASCSTRILKV